jgi:hypothetical protein
LLVLSDERSEEFYEQNLIFSLVTFFCIKAKESNPPEAAGRSPLIAKRRNNKTTCGRAAGRFGVMKLTTPHVGVRRPDR